MSTDPDPRWARVEALFWRVVDLPEAERAGFLAAECGGDDALRVEVESLVASDDEAFLRDGWAPAVHADPLASPGVRIGRYRLVAPLGEGGMGLVWAAERDDGAYEQRVAVKLLKRGLDTNALLRRFEEERRVLAQLTHPNVARLLDGGATDDGRPYLVLELVEGRPIDAYARERGLDLDARLALFEKVCAAVAHAHRNLVVHRDLKPSNVLVDEQGEPKLLDFGIAKVLDAGRADLTSTGEARPLTPRYASPEQLRGEPVTTLSDVYALGLLLFELLTDTAAHDAATARTGTRPVTGATAPPPPSRVAPADRAGALRGDLDTIVGRALKPDPDERYASARELAEDVRRFRAELPVLARPDTFAYRARKFVARHTLAVAASALAFLGVVGGGVAAFAMYLEAEDARRQEAASADEARWRAFVTALTAADGALLATHAGAEARALLDGADAGLRGWEWAHLDARVDRSLWRRSLPGQVFAVAVRPGDTLLAVGGQARPAGFLHLVDGRDGAIVARLEGHERSVRAVAFTADGSRLATACEDGALRVWDVASRTIVAEARTDLRIEALAVARGGDALAVAGSAPAEGHASAFLVVGGASAVALAGAVERTAAIAFSPDGARVAAGDGRGRIAVWRVADGELLAEARIDASVRGIAFEPDGAALRAATGDGTVALVGADDGVVRARSGGPTRALPLAVDPARGRALFASAAGLGGTNRVWGLDLATGEPAETYAGWPESSQPSAAALSADGARAFVATTRGELLAFDADGSPAARVLRVGASPVTALAATADAFATGTSVGAVAVWEPASGLRLLDLPRAHADAVLGVGLWIDGSVLSTGQDGRLLVHAPDGRRTAEVALDAPGTALAVAPDGRSAIVAVEDGALLAVDAEGVVSELARDASPAFVLAFDPAGGRLAALRGTDVRNRLARTVSVLDPATGAVAWRRRLEGFAETAVWTDGALAVGGPSDLFLLLDPATGETLASVEGDAARTRYAGLALAPGGRLVAATSALPLRVFDAERAAPVVALRSVDTNATLVAAVGDSGWIVGANRFGQVSLWGTPSAGSLVGPAAARRAFAAAGTVEEARARVAADPWLDAAARAAAERVLARVAR